MRNIGIGILIGMPFGMAIFAINNEKTPVIINKVYNYTITETAQEAAENKVSLLEGKDYEVRKGVYFDKRMSKF